MSKKCGFEGCKSRVELCCECKVNNNFCIDHIVDHIKKIGHNHLVHSNYLEIKPDSSSKIISDLHEKCRSLLALKSSLKTFTTMIIEYINQKTKNILKKVSEDLRYFKSIEKVICEKGEIEREIYEKLSVSTHIDVQLPKDFKALKEEINLFYHSNFKIIDVRKEDKEYFWISQKNLVKIDLDLLRKSEYVVNHSSDYINSCKLPDGKFFINSVGSENCYILDLTQPQLIPIQENCPTTTYYGVLACIDNVVFMINGYSTSMNEKYDLNTKKWGKVATCPLIQHVNTGGIILDKICLTCYNQSNAYVYDPVTDFYSNFLNLPKGYKLVGHGYILTSQSIFKLEGNDFKSWKNYQYRNKESDCCYCMMNTYIFRKGKYLYFCNCSQQLFRFDTKSLEYKVVNYT